MWRMSSRRKCSLKQAAIGTLAVIIMLGVCGCGDFFAHEPTEIQTKKIFQDLSRINTVPDFDRPLPDIYTQGPKMIVANGSVILFYFTRHHTPDKLASLLTDQISCKVSKNNPTNQLIVKCPNQETADIVLEFLNEVDVPPVQVRIDCLISEVFADLTMDYETKMKIENLFGEITLGSYMPGASLREPARKNLNPGMGFDLGMGLKVGVDTGDSFKAVLDILESRGYAKILMRPSVEVTNGATAKIETKERVPIPERIFSGGDIVETIIYKDVVDYLEVTPQVYADGTIGLKTSAAISSRSIPDGVTQAPIITSRRIDNEENRLRKGQSLVIGGIMKTERISVVRGVPFLKDIPLVGIIFSGKDFEDRTKEILFILTPTISSNGLDHKRVIEDIRRKHAMPEYKRGLQEVITDPFGSDVRRDYRHKSKTRSKKTEPAKKRPSKAKTTEDTYQIRKILGDIEDKLRESSDTKTSNE